MCRRVRTELSVGDVDIAQGTVMGEEGELRLRNSERDHPADRTHGTGNRNEHRRIASAVLEQLAIVQAAARTGGPEALSAHRGTEFS